MKGSEEATDAGPELHKGLGPLEQFDTNDDGSADTEDFLPDSGVGGTPMPHTLDIAKQVLDDQGRPDARKLILVVTDGLPDYNLPGSSSIPYSVTDPDTGDTYEQNGTYNTDSGSGGDSDCTELNETEGVADDIKAGGIDILAVGIGIGDTDCDPDEDGNPIGGDTFLECRVAGLAGSSPSNCAPDQFFDPDDDPEFDSLDDVSLAIAQQLTGSDGTGEQVIFRGTLRDAETALTGEGIALDWNPETEERAPYPAFATHCFGFAWWVPRDVGNHIQSDKATFDLAFYAEQARNNDSPGQTI
jgi:hypothetical protein